MLSDFMSCSSRGESGFIVQTDDVVLVGINLSALFLSECRNIIDDVGHAW